MKKLTTLGIILVFGLSFTKAQVPQYVADSLNHILELYQGGNSIPDISAAVNIYDVEDKHSISVLRNDTFINCESVAKALAKALNVLITTEIFQGKIEKMVEIYPNPADEFFIVRLNGKHDTDYKLQLFDLSGKQIYFQNINITGVQQSFKIGTKDLNPGTYILKLCSETDVITHKIINKN
ncbi:MAG: T9SS type A sorting domain-containing protein [Bacteroidales bacterium]|nr:T9SS type A sorting domain-containing protein [Bacteroidales bacterium]